MRIRVVVALLVTLIVSTGSNSGAEPDHAKLIWVRASNSGFVAVETGKPIKFVRYEMNKAAPAQTRIERELKPSNTQRGHVLLVRGTLKGDLLEDPYVEGALQDVGQW